MEVAVMLVMVASWCNVPGWSAPKVQSCRTGFINCIDYLKANTIDTGLNWQVRACLAERQALEKAKK